jgi:hypothetical protein
LVLKKKPLFRKKISPLLSAQFMPPLHHINVAKEPREKKNREKKTSKKAAKNTSSTHPKAPSSRGDKSEAEKSKPRERRKKKKTEKVPEKTPMTKNVHPHLPCLTQASDETLKRFKNCGKIQIF